MVCMAFIWRIGAMGFFCDERIMKREEFKNKIKILS